MNNIRKQTYSLEQYLKLMNDETIRTDQECQRMSGQWSSNMVNELIATVHSGRRDSERNCSTVDY